MSVGKSKLGGLLAAIIGATILLQAYSTRVSVAQDSDKNDKSTKRAGPRGRLPANWTKLDISENQREKIYAIQKRARELIEPLQAQIDEIESRRDAEMLAVLSKEQREKLRQIMLEAKSKRDSKKRTTSQKPADSAKRTD